MKEIKEKVYLGTPDPNTGEELEYLEKVKESSSKLICSFNLKAKDIPDQNVLIGDYKGLLSDMTLFTFAGEHKIGKDWRFEVYFNKDNQEYELSLQPIFGGMILDNERANYWFNVRGDFKYSDVITYISELTPVDLKFEDENFWITPKLY